MFRKQRYEFLKFHSTPEPWKRGLIRNDARMNRKLADPQILRIGIPAQPVRLNLRYGISQVDGQAYPVRTDIGPGHDTGDEGIGMRIPRFQIDVQHIKWEAAFFTGDIQCELNDNPGILSTGKRDIYPLKSVKDLLQPQARRREHIHTKPMPHTACSTSFLMAFLLPFSLLTSFFSSSSASAFRVSAERMRSSNRLSP